MTDLILRLEQLTSDVTSEELRKIDAEIFCSFRAARLEISEAGHWVAVYPDGSHDTIGATLNGEPFRTYFTESFFPRYTTDINAISVLEKKLPKEWYPIEIQKFENGNVVVSMLHDDYDSDAPGADICSVTARSHSEPIARIIAMLKALENSND